MKKFIKAILCAALVTTFSLSVAGCGNGKTILVPNDGSNCTRALFLLQENGYITLKEGVKPTDNLSELDIADSKGYTIKLVEAGQIPAQLKNGDDDTLAVINGNYALGANIKIEKAIATESANGEAASLYANIVAVKSGNENSAKTRALLAALKTQTVYDYINDTFGGAVKPSFNPAADEIPAPDSADTTITVAASPTPHAEILEKVKSSLEAKGWTVVIREFDDYVLPNNAVQDGSADANYFQHKPYLDTFNAAYNTTIVSVGAIHYEPFGLYNKDAVK